MMNKEENDSCYAKKNVFARKVFICACCNNLLDLPVMLVENIGNVCNTCFENKIDTKVCTFIPNTVVDDLIKEFKFPCKYEGCNYLILYENFKSHEKECEYRPINCAFQKTDCNWVGSKKELLKHFKEEHPHHIHINKMTFEMNIKSPINIVKLLLHQEKIFILKIWEVGQERNLLHLIQDLTPSDKETHIVVQYIGEDLNLYRFSLRCHPINNTNPECISKKICFSILQEIANLKNSVNVMVKFEIQDMTETIMTELECSICKELMRPPISQCSSGHSFCSSCKKRTTQCPTCQANWSSARNYSLEGIASVIEYPCTFSENGCKETVIGKESDCHTSICDYQILNCPRVCGFRGNYIACKDHFAQFHKDFLIEGTTYHHTFNLSSRSVSEETKYFFEYGNTYQLDFCYNLNYEDSYSWYVQHLKDYNKNFQYFYKVTIIGSEGIVSNSVLCLENCTTRTLKNGITYLADILNIYKTKDNCINCCLEIFRCKV